MSDATYRIEVEHDPAAESEPWRAIVYRVSDGYAVQVRRATTSTGALERAREAVRLDAGRKHGFALYVDDNGSPAATPTELHG